MSPQDTSFHPTKVRLRRILGATVVLVAGFLTACSDSTAPAQNALKNRAGYLTISAAVRKDLEIKFNDLYEDVASMVPSAAIRGDTTVQSFTVTPSLGKLIFFGQNTGNVLAIPPKTLCDPKANTYGPTEWKKPCTLATAPITFEVRSWKDALGHSHAEFYPALRFNPAAPKPVTLYFRDPNLQNYTNFRIPYCDKNNVCVDEGATDPALETFVTPLPTGGYYVYRALRHFSGYNVTAN